jgi:hypothetical protein
MHTKLVRKLEEKRPFGRSRHRSGHNVKTDFKEMVFKAMDWIHMAQYRA